MLLLQLKREIQLVATSGLATMSRSIPARCEAQRERADLRMCLITELSAGDQPNLGATAASGVPVQSADLPESAATLPLLRVTTDGLEVYRDVVCSSRGTDYAVIHDYA